MIMHDEPVCRLPPADRARRTADFRALFADALIESVRVPGGVRWTLRTNSSTETESRRLAALEARCCDGIRFDVSRQDERVVWQIVGPASAAATLDAFARLPVLLQTDDGAAEWWATLDAATCAERRTSTE
jgi:hypothetical protein